MLVHSGHGDVGALGAGAAGGGDGDDVLLVHHGEALEVQVVDRVGTLAAQQLAQVHDGAAAHGDDAVIAVVGDGVVHDLDHFLAGLAGAELLLEHIVALQAKVLHEGGVDELVGQHHIPLIQLELLRHLSKGLELVHRRGKDDLSLVRPPSGKQKMRPWYISPFQMKYGDTGGARWDPAGYPEVTCGRWPSSRRPRYWRRAGRTRPSGSPGDPPGRTGPAHPRTPARWGRSWPGSWPPRSPGRR